jgi:sterol desaturase/sphingolipid hydroxylase (fatty acid hydroxylase superfamily)
MDYVFVFLLWTFCLYWIHRVGHEVPMIRDLHLSHHAFINKNRKNNWHWNNLFLFNDNWSSTLDLWVTEVIPTIIFSYITGYWFVSILYYVWAAFLQEALEHNPQLNLYPFTSGQWHLIHHKNVTRNFGLFLPLWDKMFKTERRINE